MRKTRSLEAFGDYEVSILSTNQEPLNFFRKALCLGWHLAGKDIILIQRGSQTIKSFKKQRKNHPQSLQAIAYQKSNTRVFTFGDNYGGMKMREAAQELCVPEFIYQLAEAVYAQQKFEGGQRFAWDLAEHRTGVNQETLKRKNDALLGASYKFAGNIFQGQQVYQCIATSFIDFYNWIRHQQLWAPQIRPLIEEHSVKGRAAITGKEHREFMYDLLSGRVNPEKPTYQRFIDDLNKRNLQAVIYRTS